MQDILNSQEMLHVSCIQLSHVVYHKIQGSLVQGRPRYWIKGVFYMDV